MYKARTHNSFEKNFKRIAPIYKETILTELEKIQTNPKIGEITKGNLHKLDIKKYPIKDTNPEYRILYKIYKCKDKNTKTLKCSMSTIHDNISNLNSCEGLVDFLIIGTPEMFNNYYKLPLDKLKRYL